MANKTKDWQLYQNGVRYNNRLEPNYYDTVNANLSFFEGNQWRNLPDSDMPKPVFNIIKRVITFFVASLTTSKAKLHYDPPMYNEEFPEPTRANDVIGAKIATTQTELLFEKFKMEFRIKDALFDGAITGDYAAHLYFDMSKKPYGSLRPEIKGEICFELVDGSNVFFGNANNRNVDAQPYIIISGRDMVKHLQEEAARYGEQNEVKEDTAYGYESGQKAQIEVEGDESGKAEYIIVYRKQKKKMPKTTQDPLTGEDIPEIDPMTGEPVTEEVETIVKTKSTESAYIYQDIDTGLSKYPVAWGNWERTKNSYHGRAVCTGMLPNQIFINRMFGMVMYHLMMTAFPKAVYNSDFIDLWDNGIGEAIGVSGIDPNLNLKNIASYLEPSQMSNQIMQALEMAMQYTKEMLGASDAALGQIDPKNTSAIIAVQKSSAIPLENPKSNLYEWIEDIGKVLFDMMGTYYGLRPVMLEDGTVMEYDFSQFKHIWLDVTADVGESSYWSEIASMQTLDNLLAAGHITIEDYLKRAPGNIIPQKEELIQEIQQRMMAQAQMMVEQQAMMGQGTPAQPPQ